MLCDRAEKSLKAAPQICGFAYVRFSLGAFAAQEKYSGPGGSGSKDFEIMLGRKFQALGQHKMILVGISPRRHGANQSLPEVRAPELLPEVAALEGDDPAHLV